MSLPRHCEEQSDEAIQRTPLGSGLLRFARKLAAAISAALLLAAPASAGPRTIDDCEAIKDANAYNLCLASFGPVRGQHGASYPGVAAEGEKRGAAEGKGPEGKGPEGKPSAGKAARGRRAGAALGYHASVSRSHSGRVRMEFTPSRR